MPGPVTSPLAEVPLALIRDGATMIRDADDLLDDLGLVAPVAAEPVEPPIELPEDERLVWTSLIESSCPTRSRTPSRCRSHERWRP